jgi:hypothetical protein
MIDQAKRVAANIPIIDVIELKFQILEFGRKKKKGMIVDKGLIV